MSYINDKEYAILDHLWQEIRDNEGFVSEKTFFEFSEVMRGFDESKKVHTEKSSAMVKAKRSEDKSYGHSKKKPLFETAYVYLNGGTKKNAGGIYKTLRAEEPEKIDLIIDEYKSKSESDS